MKNRTYLRAIDILNLSYLALLISLILLFHHNLERWWYYFIIHLGVFLFYVWFCRITAYSTSRFVRLLRDAITPLLLIFYYEQTGNLNHMIFKEYFDPFFAGVESGIFGGQPALVFYKTFPHPLFSEYMHFSYFSYYCLIPWLGLPLWISRRHKEYDSLIFACMFNMAFCFLFFIVVPCAGPWFYFAEKSVRRALPGYFFVPIMEFILEHGEIANGAFPSSHVAMATVILLYARKYQRVIFWTMLPVVLGLYASTVYTQAHYLIDVPSGFAVGVFFFLVSDSVKTWLERTLPLRLSDDNCEGLKV